MEFAWRIGFVKGVNNNKMDEIMDKVRELGELIQSSEQMKRVKEAEREKEEDENAKTYLLEFNMKQMNLARDMQNGKISREDAVAQNTKAFDEILEKSQTLRNFVDAKKGLDALVNQINATLNYYITGQDPNCTHDCSTCGGCH